MSTTTPEFEKAYKRLNPEQKRAVDMIEGPVMVIAGPGTGKTQILALRIANILLKTDTPPSGILALTFTDAGEREMKKKLRHFIGARADEIGIFTFHGFARFIIGEYPEYFPHLFRTKQITEIEAESIVRDLLRLKKFSKLRPLGEPEFYVAKILKSISDAKREDALPAAIRDFAEKELKRIKSDKKMISKRGATKGRLKAEGQNKIDKCERTIIFADFYEEYEKRKKAEKLIDFDDLIFELTNALRKNKLLLRLIQERYLYCLVDEHQDTNDTQNSLLRLLADFFDIPNLFVVGDEKQAIYRFQGASVENFLRFEKRWKEMKTISLVHNYRSHQGILDATFSMIERNYAGNEHKNLRVRLQSAIKTGSRPIEVITAGNTEAADKYLVDAIKSTAEADKEALMAVIVRRNFDVERTLSLLEANEIKASADRGADIFSHPVGALALHLFKFLGDRSEIESLAYCLAAGLFGLPFSQSALFIRKIRAGKIFDVEREIPELKILEREITKSGAINFLVLAGDMSGIAALARRDPLSVEVWRSLIWLAMDIARRKAIQDPKELITELLSYKKTAESKSVKISEGSADAKIKVMTAHGSKGLEFDYVFLPYATEQSWMTKSRGSVFVLPWSKDREDDEIKDERRLFYVALTRARKHAVVMLGLEDGLENPQTPLRFLDELDRGSVRRVDIPRLSGFAEAKKHRDLRKKENEKFSEYAKNVLLEHGLSVTALNHFCECPSKFFYLSVLRVPEAPSASAEKGTAMHEAISRVWQMLNRNEKKIAETLRSSVWQYLEEKSLLGLFEKQMVWEELSKNAEAVAKSLKPHFASSGKVFPEKWVEAEYDKIALHGKLDVILDNADSISVFDYKTRKAMSENEVRGLTKNSDGNYFRQLVFYKILLGKNARNRNKAIYPALVFVTPDRKGDCRIVAPAIKSADERKVFSEIDDLLETVWSGKLVTKTCGQKDCQWCQLRELM